MQNAINYLQGMLLSPEELELAHGNMQSDMDDQLDGSSSLGYNEGVQACITALEQKLELTKQHEKNHTG